MRLTDDTILKFYHVTIDQKDRDKFKEATIQNITASTKEKGNLLMLTGHDDRYGTSNYMLNCYEDEDSFEKYKASPQSKRYNDAVNGIISIDDSFDMTPQLILTKDPLNVTEKDSYYIQLSKFTLVDEDLAKFGKELTSEIEALLINEEDFVGAIAGNFFDIENEWRVFTIFKNRAAYERHILGKWHHKFDVNTHDMIYDSETMHLNVDCLVDQGELSYRSKY